MSGFELDRQVLADKLPLGKDMLSQNGQEDVNRTLLAQLKQSSDIARDLASLYADRPYVYARVMKQLSSVLGGTKVRKLHNEVKARAKALSERAVANAKAGAKTSLRAGKTSSAPGGATDGSGADTEGKKITLNVPSLGIAGKEVELKAEGGSYQIKCDGWGCPFLNLVSATAYMKGTDLDRIELTAGLKGKFIKENSGSSSTVTITHLGGGSFKASGSLNADLDIPGIEGLKGTFTVGEDETAKVTADISGNASMFNKTLNLSSAIKMSVGETTDFSGSLTVDNSTPAGGGEGAGAGDAAVGTAGEEGAEGSGPMNFTGTITVNAAGSEITSMAGDITVSNLGFLADADESIKLDVTFDGEAFSASLGGAVAFKEHVLPDEKSTVALTINSASYTDEALSANCTVVGKLGDLLTVTGNADFVSNALQAGSLTIDVPSFAIPKENSFIDGSMTGTANFDASGFTGAEAEAVLSLQIGTSAAQLSLSPFTVSSTGVVSGHVDQIETFTCGCVTAEQFKADFSTDCETLISSLSGILRVDHQYLKSDEAGIPLSYDGTELKASGNLKFLENEKDELGTCEFSASVGPEGFKGDGKLTLSKDMQVGESKLQLCESATATVGIEGETLKPITFSGKYKYGYPTGGGAGGEGGGAEATAADAAGGETAAAGKDLKFSGEIDNCVFDPETGMLSGSATAKLDATIKLGSDDLYVEFQDSFRQSETALEIAFENSALTSVSGTIVAKAGIKMKNDKLVLEGYLKNFTYDVAGNSFTGIVDVGLNENFDLDAEKTVVLQGKKQNGIKVTLESNEVTDIEADLDVELNPKSTMFKGKPKFDCEAKNMKIDPQTGAINCDPITVTCAKDAVICLHEDATEITLGKDSNLTTAITDSEPTYLTGDISYSGETSVFSEGDAKDFKFDGTVTLNITDVKDPSAGITGSVTMNVTDDYTMDAIEGVDEIDLLAGTSLNVELTETGLTDIGGNFTIRYIYKAGQNEHLPSGLNVELSGSELHYNVPNRVFDGTISLNAVEDILINIDAAGDNTFKIIGGESGLTAELNQNELKSLAGTAGFLAHFKIGEDGTIDIGEGSSADLDIDVSSFGVNSLTVDSNITCNFKVGNVTIKTDEAIKAGCEIDAEGLKEASITGAAHLIIPINGNDCDLVVEAAGEGVKYTRESGVNGDPITVTCNDDAIIDVHEDATEITIAKGSSLTTAIANSEPTYLKGDISFTGETSIFSEGEDRDFKFDGTGNIDVADVKDPSAGVSGSVTMNVTNDYTMDAIEGVDEIDLLAGTSLNVALSQDGLTDIGGNFTIRYIYNAGQNEHLPNGLNVELSGTELHYNVPNRLFDGTISLNAVDDILINIDASGNNSFTLVGGESGLTAELEQNKLKSLVGTAGFLAHFKIGEEGSLDIGEGSNATLDVNVSSFGVNSLTVDSSITCNFKVGNVTIKTDEAIKAGCDIDAEGLKEASITGAAHLIVPVNGNDCDLIVEAAGEGVTYSRENGVNGDPITVTCNNDAVIDVHEDATELTIGKGSSLTTAIANSEPTYLKGDITFTGETSIFSEGEDRDFKFSGTGNIDIADVKDPSAGVTGSVTMNVTNDYTMDAIEGVDEIDLVAGSSLDVALSQEGLTDIGGNITIRYIYNAGQNEHLPNGLNVELSGTDLKYNVPNRLFDGTITLSAGDDILINLDSGGENNITLVAGESSLSAVLEQNKLMSLGGGVGFLAHFKVGDSGTFDIVEGSNATIGLDVSTFAVNSLSVEANMTCDFKVGSATVKTDEAITASCNVDAEGLKDASITGAAHLIVPVNGNDLDLIVATGADGMNYTRETGVNGDIQVTCENKTELGSFTRTSSEGTSSVFKYGLGQCGEGGEGGGAAAGFTATVAEGELTQISGEGGFFLEQEGTDDPLKVSGNISFDCAISPDVNLTSAHGDVKIERKTLFGSPETLVLGESIAQINIENNQLIDLSGKVELFLNDNGGSADGGDYLKFTTTGSFDCIDSKTFTGDVSASIIREKQLGSDITTSDGKAFGIYLSPEAGDTGFDTSIEENVIKQATGNLGVMTKLDGEPYFSGSVNGSYKAASEGVESNLSGTGSIKLLQDIDMLDGKFRICKGSNGTATIENNEISTLSGDITIAIAAPNKSFDESCIKVTATSTIDVKEAKITEFVGTASLEGEFPVTSGLALTSLNATVSIHDNTLDEISGGASVRYEKAGFTIEGACTSFRWLKGSEGAEDGFSFAGELSVTGMDGKLSGSASVSYDTIADKSAAPVIKGDLSYQFNEWLGGEIGIRFDGTGWDDPVLHGKLKVKDATLIPGRQLLGFNPDPMTLFEMSYAIFNFGAGFGMGLSIDLDPVVFNAEFDVEDFHLGKDAGMPKFETNLSLESGLSLKASVSPFIKFSLGVADVIEAGMKIKGVASLTADAGLSLEGKLKGGEDGLSGEVGLGFDVSGGVTLSVVPAVFAKFFDNEAESDITTWTFDLGNIFNFSWGKRFGFGTNGTTELGDAPKTALTPTTTVDASAEGTEEVSDEYAPKPAPAKQQDGPDLPGSKDIADEANGSDEGGEGGGSDFADKMERISKIATAFGNIAEAVSFIAELVTAAVTGNVAGVVVFLVIKILKGELDITQIPTKVKEIIEGIEALKELIEDNPDFLQSLMPEWLKNVIDFFQNMPTIPELCDIVVEKVTEKVAALGSPMDRILQPLVDFVADQAEKIVEIYELFEAGGVGNIVKGIFRIIGLGFSSAIDLINALKSMWDIFCQVVVECVASGNIFVKYEERHTGLLKIPYNYYFWQLEIPNLICFSGEGAILDALAAELMLGLLHSAGLEAQRLN